MDETTKRGGFADVDGDPDPAYYADYLRALAAHPEVQRYRQRALEALALQPGETVLDVGCGLGDGLQLMAPLIGAAGMAVGVDRSAVLLSLAPRGFHVQADALRLPFADGSFHAARCDRVLVHLSDPAAAVRELARVLRPAGRLVVTEGDFITMTLSGADPQTTRAVCKVIAEGHSIGAAGGDLAALAEQAGLVDVTVRPDMLVITDLPTADRFWALRPALREAVARGAVPLSAALAWLAELRRGNSRGEFACALTGYGLKARKN